MRSANSDPYQFNTILILNNPDISIILPFYQSADTLHQAIESIYRQTFLDWVLILVNNNASDGSAAIAQEWMARDARIRMVAESRQGIAYALNTGLREATAPLIARMDADDIALPTRLAKQYKYLRQHPAIGVVATQCQFQSTIAQSRGYELFVDWQNQILSPEAHFLNRFIESPVAHPSVMFRQECVAKYGNYHTGRLPEDYELWLRWMAQGVEFAKIPEKLLIWQDYSSRLSRHHAHYQQKAFFQVKCHYLAQWLIQHVDSSRKILICGTSKVCRMRADLLVAEGIEVYGFTDVRNRQLQNRPFVAAQQIQKKENYFVINFISKRGVGQAIRQFLTSRGLTEGIDFLLAA